MRPISWPLNDLVLPTEKSAKPHPLGARKRPSFKIAIAFARSKNPSSKVHKPISLHRKQIQPCHYHVTGPNKTYILHRHVKGNKSMLSFSQSSAQKKPITKGLNASLSLN